MAQRKEHLVSCGTTKIAARLPTERTRIPPGPPPPVAPLPDAEAAFLWVADTGSGSYNVQMAVSRWFVTNESPSRELISYLHSGLLHVHADLPFQAVPPNEFYRGLDTSWECVRQQLDVRRRVTDDILLNGRLDKNSNELIRAFHLKGHAGSGKDVTLRRVAEPPEEECDED